MSEKFELEVYDKQETVRRFVRACEGKHSQQVAYSSFHDCLTRVCFGCKKIRTNGRFL